MGRKYSPNHPTMINRQDLNRPYRLPLTGFGLSMVGGVLAVSYLPMLAVFSFPFAFIWAAPFIAGGVACFHRCLTLLEQEKKRG
jgi:hypothetical protein